MKLCKCDLCGNKYAEFTVTSKHLAFMLKKLKKYNKKKLDHITKHICDKCFVEIFREKKTMNKKIEITKERLEQLEGFERIVQAMKNNGFDTFKSVKEFLQDHKRLEAAQKNNISAQLGCFENYINDIPLIVDPCCECVHAKDYNNGFANFDECCHDCCWFYDSNFEGKK